MLNPFVVADHTLTWRNGQHILTVQPWGADSVRVRAGLYRILDDLPGALGAPGPAAVPDTSSIEVDSAGGSAILVNGRVRVEVVAETGLVSFHDTADGREVLGETPAHYWWPGSRYFEASGNGLHRIEQRFAAYPDERVYGLGQHGHGRLDQKGMVIELAQRNGEVSIPFVLSSRGYGLLWNSPAIGRVELAARLRIGGRRHARGLSGRERAEHAGRRRKTNHGRILRLRRRRAVGLRYRRAARAGNRCVAAAISLGCHPELLRVQRAKAVFEILLLALDLVVQLLHLMGEQLVLAGGLAQRVLEILHALLQIGDRGVLVLLVDARGLLLVALAEQAGMRRRGEDQQRREAAKDQTFGSHLVTAFRERLRILSRNWGRRLILPVYGRLR